MECLMDHIVVNVTDVEKMVAFYNEVLGMPPERLEEYRAGRVPFPSVRLNADTVIDLFPKRLWENDAPEGTGHVNLNHFCVAFNKEAWDALRDRLENHGVAIDEGPVPRWGAHGTGTSVYFRDPENNRIEARYYEDSDTSRPCMLGS
jgi:catechol 2,3-dioxygenase-like lactoylglutathione lyase family enzyme